MSAPHERARLATVVFTVAGCLPLALTVALALVLVRGVARLSGFDGSLFVLALGSLKVVSIALMLALPTGLGIAIYLNEFCSRRFRRRLKPLVEVLAAVPTVVWGYFALMLLTPTLARIVPGLPPLNSLSAALAVGFMVVPTFATLCDDAIFEVPRDLREGAYALGADRGTTVVQVIVPSAAWGLLSAALLTISRALGESMIVLVAAGHANEWTFDPRAPGLSMPAAIAELSLGDSPVGGQRTVFSAALILLVVSMTLSAMSYRLARLRVHR